MKDILNGICRSHLLADELNEKPDDFITASVGDKEYIIQSVKRVPTHANIDDSVTHWTLQLRECKGNIIR